MSKEEYLSNKYKKWDNFKDDSDSEGEEVPRKPTQFEVEGDEDIVVSTEMLLTPPQLDKIKRLDQPHQEVWQIVVRKLRVWSASSTGAEEGADAIPCRPYCILVNNLYPMGQVISKKIVDPPEVYPSAQEVLDVTIQAMLDPPANTPQHRPNKICFPDKTYVGQLRKSFAAIGIECSFLSESQGIDTYIQELSNHLVRNDLASVAEVSERPGLVSGDGITPELLKPFYDACAMYASLEPWVRLAERQAIQIDARDEIRLDKRHNASGGAVFASVIATNTTQGQIQGMALFFTRADLERRVLPAGEQLALMENPTLRRCAFCDKKAPKGQELKKCTRCKCAFYCGAACQRAHWKDHKISCVPASDIVEQKGERKIVWGAKEMSILYGAQTSLPFDDLDAIDTHKLAIAKVKGEWMYPAPVVFKFGEPSIPNATDLLWLTRGLLAFIELMEKHPLFMQATMVSQLGLEDEDGEKDDEREQPKVEMACQSLGFDDHLVIRNSAVLTMQDVEKLREYITSKKSGNGRTLDGVDENGSDGGDADSTAGTVTHDGDQGEDQSKCSLM